jgi:hypothetical protein
MSLLDSITGPKVEATGIVGAAACSAALLRAPSVAAIVGLLGIYSVLRLWRRAATAFSFLKGFAEVPAWPEFVLWGVAALFVGHAGGWRADVVLAFMLTAADGRMFGALY